MIIHPPVEATFDDGLVPRKSWVDWCVSVFRNSKFKGSGTTADRPVNGLNIGDWFFDTTLNRPVFVTAVSPVAWTDILSFLGFSAYFESAEQTITSAGALTIAHGLGREPIFIQTFLVCKTAEDGYTAGQKVIVNPSLSADGGGASGLGTAIVPDATNINVRYGDTATVFQHLHFTTGVLVTLTNANWRLVIRAWA